MQPAIDHLEVAKETVQILRGEHPGWTGDRILNAEVFLANIGKKFHGAQAFARQLNQEKDAFSELLGIPPDRVVWMANRITDGVNSRYAKPV